MTNRLPELSPEIRAAIERASDDELRQAHEFIQALLNGLRQSGNDALAQPLSGPRRPHAVQTSIIYCADNSAWKRK